jgi:hypothetical protein
MKRFKKTLFIIGTIIIFAGCGVISAFLLASGYESIYNRSLPLVNTIDEVDLRAFGQAYNLDYAIPEGDKIYGNYGKPLTLKLPQRPSRLDLVQPIKDKQTWLARANTLHLLIPEEPRNGSMGLAIVYCRTGLRTLEANNLPAQGSNLFIDTDHSWRYVYKVTSTATAPASQNYIIADDGKTSKMVVACYDKQSGNNIYVETTLISVQGIEV